MSRKRKPTVRQPTSAENPPQIDRFGTLNAFTYGEQGNLATLMEKTKSPATGLLWYVLFVRADGQTGLIYGASIEKLMKWTGMARNTVKKALEHLRDQKISDPPYLEIVKERDVKEKVFVPVYRLNHAPK